MTEIISQYEINCLLLEDCGELPESTQRLLTSKPRNFNLSNKKAKNIINKRLEKLKNGSKSTKELRVNIDQLLDTLRGGEDINVISSAFKMYKEYKETCAIMDDDLSWTNE